MAPTRQTTLDGSFVRRGAAIASSRTGDGQGRVDKRPPPRAAPAVRKESDVLLAIRPEHLANIVSRQKNHEYRKYRLRDGVTRLWLYETKDGGAGRASITHIAVIPASVRHTPGSVPAQPVGIGNADFNAGLKESKYGYPIMELYELARPVTLPEMKSRWAMAGAPMGWSYVKEDLWADRWGDEDADRAGKAEPSVLSPADLGLSTKERRPRRKLLVSTEYSIRSKSSRRSGVEF